MKLSAVMASATGLRAGQVTRAEAAPGAGAVHRGGLVQFVRGVLQSGEQRDRRLRHARPDADDDHRGQGGGEAGEPVAAVAQAAGRAASR